MKTITKFSPIKIDELTEQKNEFKRQLEAKKNAFNELILYVEQFIPIEHINDFLDGENLDPVFFLKTFSDKFLTKYINSFPPISINKMFELMNFDVEKLNVKITLINSIEIDVNFNTGEAVNVPVWEIYTETPAQNKKYKALSTILNGVDELKEQGLTVYPAGICQAFSGAVLFDFRANKLKVNSNFILGLRH